MKNAALRRFRDEQKAIAARITSQRNAFKDSQRAGAPIHRLDRDASHDSYDYRHRHIAYCLARGTPMEAIEKPGEGHEPNMKLVDGILKTLREDVAREQSERQDAVLQET